MSDYAYENVPVALRLKDGAYEIGAVIEGGFFAFGSFKAGGFEDDLAEAKANADKTSAEAPAPGTVPPVQP